MDLVLAQLRRLLAERPELKAVVMSATLQAEALARYFGPALCGPAPAEAEGGDKKSGGSGSLELAGGSVGHLVVPAATNYPVAEHFLEDLPGHSNLNFPCPGLMSQNSSQTNRKSFKTLLTFLEDTHGIKSFMPASFGPWNK